MKSENYEARFQPAKDDENMRNLAYDLASLMHNSNWLGRASTEQDKRLNTYDNIYSDMSKRITALEDYLYRD